MEQSPKQTAKSKQCWKRFKALMFENKLSNPEVKKAFKESQTDKIVVLSCVYLATFLAFLFPGFVPMTLSYTRENYDHREFFPELNEFYPPLNEDLQLDANYHKLI